MDQNHEYDGLYTKRLDDLVASCLKEDVRKRIGISDLKRKVVAGLRAFDGANGRMRNVGSLDVPGFLAFNFEDEGFGVGSLLRSSKHRRGSEYGGRYGNGMQV